MFYHYILSAVRNILRQKSHAIINILGLTLGLSICLVIWIYVLNELSYDKFFDDYRQIYRVHNTVHAGTGDPQTIPASMFGMAEIAKEDLPEVEEFVRFNSFFSSLSVSYEDKSHYLRDVMLGDSTFFTVFSFPFLYGDPHEALTRPNSIVLTESTALLYFGRASEAYGELVTINNTSYQVTGIVKDVPENSHMFFTAVMPHYDYAESAKATGYNWYTYLKLKPGTDLSQLALKLDDIVVNKLIPSVPMLEGINFSQESRLMNVADIHLNSNLIWEMKSNGSRQSLVVFMILSVFILVVAVINFVNLATARSMLRSREIGVKKAIGASRAGLVWQFMTESFLVTLLAFVMALGLAELLSNYFSQNFNLIINTSVLLSVSGGLLLGLLVIITTLLSGLYPAFFLSSFDPVKTLKGDQTKGRGGQNFRRVLVVFQFAITILLISSLWVVVKQLRHMQKYNMGFDQEQVVVVRQVSHRIARSFQDVCAQLESRNRIQMTAGANFLFGGHNRVDIIAEDGVALESGISADIVSIDHDFLELMGIEVINGRNFLPLSQQDAQEAFIVNQTAVRALGFEQPLEKRIDLFGRRGPLVGVINDFHLKSLHSKIEPLAFLYGINGFPHIYIKLSAGPWGEAMDQIKEVLHEVDPAYVPDIVFLDQTIQSFYEEESSTSGLLSVGAILAIIIALLGVYGLAAFSAERRVKEIGIRKVLGASLNNLLWVFNRESVILVGIAFLIATPLGWYFMDGWLDNFLVRLTINPMWFLVPGIIVFVMSSVIISLQTWLTSKANPVKSLRSE